MCAACKANCQKTKRVSKLILSYSTFRSDGKRYCSVVATGLRDGLSKARDESAGLAGEVDAFHKSR
jgi:hypothetical protein